MPGTFWQACIGTVGLDAPELNVQSHGQFAEEIRSVGSPNQVISMT